MGRIFLRAIIPLLTASVLFGAPVEPNNPVYDFLRRLEAKGLMPGGFGGIQPWDSRDILAGLEAAKRKEDVLHSWDRQKLDGFLKEFSPAIHRTTTRFHSENELFSAFAGTGFFTCAAFQDSLGLDSRQAYQGFAFGSFTPWAEAEYRNRVYIISSASVGMERGLRARFTETYDTQRGLPYNTNRLGKAGIPQTVSTFDGFRAMFGYSDGTLRVEIGQDWNRFGPGHWQNAMLGNRGYFWSQDSLPASPASGFNDSSASGSYRRGYRFPGETAPMPQLRMVFTGKNFAYVKLLARRDGILRDTLATLVAHRLEWRPFSFLTLAGSELVTLGGRVPDLLYWIPLVPLKFQEHQSRGRDNANMSFDIEVRRAGLGRVYGELSLDDFSGPPLDYWGNKLVYTAGLEWQDPLHWPAIFRCEFSHSDPWMGTHNLKDTQLQSGGASLGNVLPLNSRALWTEITFPMPHALEAALLWHFMQRDPLSRGSSIFDVFIQGVDSDTKPFLAGSPETRNQWDLSLAWSWRRYASLHGGIGLLQVSNWKGRKGEDLISPVMHGDILLKY